MGPVGKHASEEPKSERAPRGSVPFAGFVRARAALSQTLAIIALAWCLSLIENGALRETPMLVAMENGALQQASERIAMKNGALQQAPERAAMKNGALQQAPVSAVRKNGAGWQTC